MLTDERPLFSIKDIGIVVSFTAAFVAQYLALSQADRMHDAEIAALQKQAAGNVELSQRMTRLEMLMCYTDDVARERACRQLGVLK